MAGAWPAAPSWPPPATWSTSPGMHRPGHPPVATMAPAANPYHAWLMGLRPAMEQMLTGDAMDGHEAVRTGFANRAFPTEALEAAVLAMAERIAQVDPELAQLNK